MSVAATDQNDTEQTDAPSICRSGVVFGDRYRLTHEVARGGMGVVWAADDLRLKRTVAVKVMSRGPDKSASSAEARSRFENEAMAAARLHSPHVVQIYDYGVEDDAQYIVMELLDGEDLRSCLKQRKRLSLDLAGKIMSHTAKALSEAHAAGIVHRDLKPGNIFLAEHRNEMVVKVLDFGVAKLDPKLEVLDSDTKVGSIIGTPQYMAPEQVHGVSDVDQRADLFSLGIILFKALTGQLPFSGSSAAGVIVNICTASIPSAHALAPDLPPEIDDFFARALAREMHERFATARQMAMAFSRIVPISVPSLKLSTVPPAAPAGDTDDDDDETQSTRATDLGLEALALESTRPTGARARDHEPTLDGKATVARQPFPPVSSAKRRPPPPPTPSANGAAHALASSSGRLSSPRARRLPPPPATRARRAPPPSPPPPPQDDESKDARPSDRLEPPTSKPTASDRSEPPTSKPTAVEPRAPVASEPTLGFAGANETAQPEPATSNRTLAMVAAVVVAVGAVVIGAQLLRTKPPATTDAAVVQAKDATPTAGKLQIEDDNTVEQVPAAAPTPEAPTPEDREPSPRVDHQKGTPVEPSTDDQATKRPLGKTQSPTAEPPAKAATAETQPAPPAAPVPKNTDAAPSKEATTVPEPEPPQEQTPPKDIFGDRL